MTEKNSHNHINHLAQHLRSQLRSQAAILGKIQPDVLRLWLLAMLHLAQLGKLKPQLHFYWVRPQNQSKNFQYDLLLPHLALYKVLSGFSRHFSQPEQQALFEAALCRTYSLPAVKRGRQKITVRPVASAAPKVFIGYRIAHEQIDYHLATIFNHPVAYRYKPANGQAELPNYPAK